VRRAAPPAPGRVARKRTSLREGQGVEERLHRRVRPGMAAADHHRQSRSRPGSLSLEVRDDQSWAERQADHIQRAPALPAKAHEPGRHARGCPRRDLDRRRRWLPAAVACVTFAATPVLAGVAALSAQAAVRSGAGAFSRTTSTSHGACCVSSAATLGALGSPPCPAGAPTMIVGAPTSLAKPAIARAAWSW
jgi:hypothetical protein